jgi:hypothetical protein
MTEKKIFKIFLIYFSLYFLIGISCAWIPFAYLSVAFGSIAVFMGAIATATLRTIDFYYDNKQTIGIKKFIYAIIIILALDCIYSVSTNTPYFH